MTEKEFDMITTSANIDYVLCLIKDKNLKSYLGSLMKLPIIKETKFEMDSDTILKVKCNSVEILNYINSLSKIYYCEPYREYKVEINIDIYVTNGKIPKYDFLRQYPAEKVIQEHEKLIDKYISDDAIYFFTEATLITKVDDCNYCIICKSFEASYNDILKTLRQIYTMNLLNKRYYKLHCSAVDYKGKGIAISGKKGAGKTTILLSLLNIPGYSYITNDMLLFNADSLNMKNWFTSCRIAQETLKEIQWLKVIDEFVLDLNNSNKILIPFEKIEDILNVSILKESKLKYVLFINRSMENAYSNIVRIHDINAIYDYMYENLILLDKDHPNWLSISESMSLDKKIVTYIVNNLILHNCGFYELNIRNNIYESRDCITDFIDKEFL